MSTERSTTETEQATVTTGTDETTDSAGKSNEPKKLTADEKKQEIVTSFQQRLDRGEITMETIAESQPWVAELLTKKEANPLAEKSALKDELKKELRLETAWDALYDLASASQKKELDEIRSSYETSLGSEEALKLATKVTGIDVSSEAKLRKSLRLREIGGEVEDQEEVRVSADDKRVAKMANADPKVVAQRRQQLEAGGKLILK